PRAERTRAASSASAEQPARAASAAPESKRPALKKYGLMRPDLRVNSPKPRALACSARRRNRVRWSGMAWSRKPRNGHGSNRRPLTAIKAPGAGRTYGGGDRTRRRIDHGQAHQAGIGDRRDAAGRGG